MRTHGQAKTRDIAGAVGLSQRHLIELFTREVGLTPKLFGRVRRFLHAVQKSDEGIDWSRLAVECGYFDQAHLIHDFVAFASVSPGVYRQRQEDILRAGGHTKRNHLPVPVQVNFFQDRGASTAA
jgi:AraC-like DNA-binding protein